jgi:amidase
MEDASTSSWKAIGQRKRESVQALLPASFRIEKVPPPEEQRDVTRYVRQFLSEKELDITENYSAEALVAKLASSSFSSADVVSAFIHRATIAHQLVSFPF